MVKLSIRRLLAWSDSLFFAAILCGCAQVPPEYQPQDDLRIRLEKQQEKVWSAWKREEKAGVAPAGSDRWSEFADIYNELFVLRVQTAMTGEDLDKVEAVTIELESTEKEINAMLQDKP